MSETSSTDFGKLLKRLEAATVRLEQLSSLPGTAAPLPPKTTAAAASAPLAPSSASLVSAAGGSLPSLEAFDALLSGPLAQLQAHAKEIGGLVAEQTALLEKAFQAERQLLWTASQCKKPKDQTGLMAALKPVSALLEQIAQLRDRNRSSPQFNHLSTISEGAPALGWVAVEPKPAPFVGEMKDAAQFYGNRILKEFKDKEKVHADWVAAFSATLVDLQAFVKKYHTTGLVWNPNGADASTFVAAASKGPAPPPPGPPPAPAVTAATATGSNAPSMNSVFDKINQGAGVTSGLRKVEKSEMTHKNPALRAGNVVKADALASGNATPANQGSTRSLAGKPAAPPKFELDGKKWCVENQNGNRELVVEADLRQTVYIFNCQNSTVQVKGKVNAVVLDSCKKCALVVESVVASVDVVNCKSVQVQILGKAPTAVVDKTDGLNLFLSRECLDLEVFTAKSSELNISVPGKKEGEDYTEFALPEQMKTKVDPDTGKLVTVIVEHKG